MASSAPPVTVRLAVSMPSAASCADARRRSRGATGASAYIRAGRRAGQAGSSGSRAGSGPPLIRSLVPAGRPQGAPGGDRGGAPDMGAGRAGPGREAPAAQVAVGGGHRGRADAELAGQLADRRQLISRSQLPGPDAGLHAGRYLLGGPAGRAISYQYVHVLYYNI